MNRKIIICEDNEQLRNTYENYISSYIGQYDFGEIVLVTEDPEEVLALVRSDGGGSDFIYFFDIELNQGMNGMVLAKEIREMDQTGEIIFITGYEQYLAQTFQYKLKALDYIDKAGDVALRITECLELIRTRVADSEIPEGEKLTISIGRKSYVYNLDSVIGFEGTRFHKVVVRLKEGEAEIPTVLKEVEQCLGEPFMRIHKSFIINKDNFVALCKSPEGRTKVAKMSDGSSYTVARQYIAEVQRLEQAND